MKAFYLKPELFSALKTLKKEQFAKDIISGIGNNIVIYTAIYNASKYSVYDG